MQMRIAVCDDEKNIRKKLVGMLDEIREICAVELEIETFAHTVAALEVFADVDVVSCRHGEISEPNAQRSAWT